MVQDMLRYKYLADLLKHKPSVTPFCEFWSYPGTLCSINPGSETVKNRRCDTPAVPHLSAFLDRYVIHLNFSVAPEESTLWK